MQYRGRAAGAQCKYSGLASDCTNSSSACHGDGCWRQTVRAHAGGGLAHASKRSFSVQGAAAALDEEAICIFSTSEVWVLWAEYRTQRFLLLLYRKLSTHPNHERVCGWRSLLSSHFLIDAAPCTLAQDSPASQEATRSAHGDFSCLLVTTDFDVNRFYPKTQLSWLARLDASFNRTTTPSKLFMLFMQ